MKCDCDAVILHVDTALVTLKERSGIASLNRVPANVLGSGSKVSSTTNSNMSLVRSEISGPHVYQQACFVHNRRNLFQWYIHRFRCANDNSPHVNDSRPNVYKHCFTCVFPPDVQPNVDNAINMKDVLVVTYERLFELHHR